MDSLKKTKILFSLIAVFSFIFITNIKAATLTESEYNRLKIIFSDARIAVMSDEEAQTYLSYDLENSNIVNKYYKVTETANGTTSVEVTKEEAENAFQNTTARGTVHTTSYKNIQISTTQVSTNHHFVNLVNKWNVTPRVKSYDVIAFRTDDAQVQSGSISGTQAYWTSANGYDMVEYSENGTNIVKKTNGFGISMNLVDAASYFECDIQAVIQSTSKYATVYGSYQHAMTNVTLAQSQAYNISHNGYGKVINFSTSVQDYYDGMQGVEISLGYTG